MCWSFAKAICFNTVDLVSWTFIFARPRFATPKGRVRAPEIPGNMAALMTVSQVTIFNS